MSSLTNDKLNPGYRTHALLLDDDVWSLRLIQRTLKRTCPELAITARNVPDADGGFDVYLIDVDFGGRPLGPRLARQIRALKPGALMIAVTGGIRSDAAGQLLGAGFDGVCDKTVPHDLQTTAECVRRYSRLIQGEHGSSPRQWIAAAREFHQVLQAWNQRLQSISPDEATQPLQIWDGENENTPTQPAMSQSSARAAN